MIPERPCTPPPPQRAPASLNLPSTPGPGCKRPVIGTEHSVVPPSPAPAAPNASGASQAVPSSQHTGISGTVLVGLPPKKLTATQVWRRSPCKNVHDRSFRFLDLPPEIRNMIYSYMHEKPSQALLVHRPRLASLRSRTRMDRSRIWPSDLDGMKHDAALATGSPRSSSRKSGSVLLPRATNRPFFGLTQACQLIRQEYRPIYMHMQEVGVDLVNVEAYLKTYYPTASALLSELFNSRPRNADLPFSGNITIAVGDNIKKAEASLEGIDALPLLDVWANSFRIEAGFGRYIKEIYVPMRDGEAKDLYRLFGRRVNTDRSCSAMNPDWRATLRNRYLRAVRLHRAPLSKLVSGRYVPQRPYIHFIYHEESAESWMKSFHSEIPMGWLEKRGFTEMEHYEIKVGIMPPKDAKPT